MQTLQHPTIVRVTQDVPDAAVDEWLAAGWLAAGDPAAPKAPRKPRKPRKPKSDAPVGDAPDPEASDDV